MSAIEADDLCHWFGRRKVLDHVHLRVAQGSVHGFVGPNGAGKTTTLNMLATLIRPKRGQIRILGVDARKEPKRVRRKVGYMPEHFAMYRQLTVFEYLDFFAAAHGQQLERRDAVIEEVVATTGIEELLGRGIGTLSRGMQQRVCLARVLLHDPMVLLLDEPASGLDPRARIGLQGVVRALAAQGRTILMSSHILGELADCCDHVTILDRGSVRFSGPLRELLARGQHGHRRYVVEVGSDGAPPLAELRAMAGVSAATADGPRLCVEFAPEATSIGAVLGRLLESGATITAVREDQRGLDEAFLELTSPGEDA